MSRAKKKHAFPDVNELFNKKFEFKKSFKWVIPNYTSTTLPDYKFDYEELLGLKQNLNAVKSKLNDFPIEEWSLHTRKRNPAGEIQWKLKTEYNTEFMTQAWCKMFECLNSYDLVVHSEEQSTFNSLHLCEAPGAFVTALNHFLKTKYQDVELKWLATTLNPYYEGNQVSTMIPDDRFLLITLNNWYFGQDFTGNIMDKENIQSLKEKCEEIQPIMLITADGSIDCLQTPEEQENKVACLHIYEVLTALSILHKGGSFLLKMFTFFECSSVSILYLLNVAFENINVFKPVTSKGGNSEVYVICLRYRPNESILHYVNLLLDSGNISDVSIFHSEDIPKDFVKQIVSCAEYFMNIQCAVIEDNISTYNKKINTTALKAMVTKMFLTTYNMKSILDGRKIVPLYIYSSTVNLNPRLHTGSYNERVKTLDISEKLYSLWARMFMFQKHQWNFSECNYLTRYHAVEMIDLLLIQGKPVSVLCNSKFILAPILDLYREARNLCDSIVTQNSNVYAWRIIHYDSTLKNYRFLCIVNPSCDPSGSYDEYEKDLFRKLVRFNINEGDNVAIWNFPTLTLFSVGVLYILFMYYFEQIAFVQCNCILFFKYKKCVRPYLQEILCKIDSTVNSSILSVVPISEICKGVFYENVLRYNNANFIYEGYLCLSGVN